MANRRTARARALQALYQMDGERDPSAERALDAAWASEGETPSDGDSARRFALELTSGVRDHLGELDACLEKHSQHWRLNRMSRIDRNILRLGCFELLHRSDIPPKVALNEAVELGKLFGSKDSSAFINGILDKVAQGIQKG